MNLEQARHDRPYTRPRSRQLLDWFLPRTGGLGMWAFTINRITGIGLVVYLLLHLVVLSLLARGPGAWDAFVTLARTPLFLLLDLVLLAGLLFHGLNGIRVALVGMGFAVTQQKRLFIALMVVALAVFGFAALRMVGA